MVVAVQHVRDAVQVLEPRDRLRFDRVARLLDFALLDGTGAKRVELRVDRRFQLLGRVAGARGRVDLELRAEEQRLLVRLDVLRDLLLVDELLIQPARAAAAENLGGDVRLGIAGLEDGRREPRHVHARELDAIRDDLAPLHGDLRRLHVDGRHRRAALQRPEVLFDQLLRLRGIEVADDGDARVVGRVIALEELLGVVEPRRLDVGVRSDDVGVVRMIRRIEHVHELLLRVAVRAVLDALPPLVAHDVLLVGELLAVDRVEQVAHPVGFNPQRELEPVRRDRLEVVRPVVVGGAVDARRARAFEHLEVRVLRRVFRPLEHQVLEQVREAGPARGLVDRPDVIPEVHRHDRQPTVLAEDDLEAVRKRVLLELNPRDLGRSLRRAVLRRERDAGGEEEKPQDLSDRKTESCLHGQSFVGSLFRLAHKYQHATER